MEPVTKRRVRRVLGVTGVAAAVVLAVGGFAQAKPEAAGTIYACVNNRTGDVRIPNPFNGGGLRCNKGERWVFWNVEGPRGPQGPRGATGTRGPAGPAGLTGSGQTATTTELVPANTTAYSIVANCPSGTVATGGGFSLSSAVLSVTANFPFPGSAVGPVTGWRAAFTNTSATATAATAYAICYTAPS